MFDSDQLNSIGFRFITDSIELMTPYGEALARRPHYYTRAELPLLLEEQRNVEKLMGAVREETAEINALMRLLMPVKDIRRSMEQLEMRTLSEVELFEVKRFLLQLELIAPKVDSLGLALSGIEITAMPGALSIIDPDGTGTPTFYVSDRLSDRLAAIRRERREVDGRMRAGEASDSLMALRTRLAAEEEDENARVRGELCMRLRVFREELLRNADSVGRLDLALGKARLAVRLGAIVPEVGGSEFTLRGMVNPRYAEALSEKGREFKPVSIELKKGSVVITGANMGGKSVAIKTLALNAMLAMCGFPVFAEEAKIPCLDSMHLLSEDREDALGGLSSFGGEMKAFDGILRETEGEEASLVLLDEFARGTNPHEGAALVRAAARLFNARSNTFAVIATHFDGVAKLARLHYQVAGLRNADANALKNRLAGGADRLADFMDYGLYPVSPEEEPPRDAVTIIRALGVKSEFTDLIDI
jgi:dsDNA-specific endonuclease/ATPase MutS2